MNKIKYFALIAAVLGSATTFAADESAFQFQNSVRVGYDDNVYAVKNNVTETAFITDIINISGNLNFSDRSEMELFWQPELRYRFDADPELVSYQDLYARLSHALSQRTFLDLSDRFRYQQKDGQSDLGLPGAIDPAAALRRGVSPAGILDARDGAAVGLDRQEGGTPCPARPS